MSLGGISGGRAFAVAAVVVAAVMLSACSQTGGGLASNRADTIADKLGEELTPPSIRSLDAAWLVATRIPDMNSEQGPEEHVTVEALSWRGNSSDEAGAQIEVRIGVDVAPHHAVSVGDTSYEADSATKCYHYAIIAYRVRAPLSRRDIPCPDGPVPTLPAPTALPALPNDARDRLTEVLVATSPRTLDTDVRAAFPQGFVTVDTAVTAHEIIAAVGVPGKRECIVAIRGADGAVTFAAFDRIWLEPGELGCSTEIVTDPPL